MKRRFFVGMFGLSVMAIGVVGYVHTSRVDASDLSKNLEPYFNAIFKASADDLDAGEILAALLEKSVVDSSGGVNAWRLEQLAKTDEVVLYKGFNYTETEIELHTLAYLLSQNKVVALEGHDLMGGDYDAKVVEGVDQCFNACQKSNKCTGFTFVKRNHPVLEKHDMCYLKDKAFTHVVDENYISGIK